MLLYNLWLMSGNEKKINVQLKNAKRGPRELDDICRGLTKKDTSCMNRIVQYPTITLPPHKKPRLNLQFFHRSMKFFFYKDSKNVISYFYYFFFVSIWLCNLENYKCRLTSYFFLESNEPAMWQLCAAMMSWVGCLLEDSELFLSYLQKLAKFFSKFLLITFP